MTFEAYLQAQQELVDRALADRVFARWSGVPERLATAMRYSLESGGKRLRPVLVLATCESLRPGPPLPAAIDYACAIELVHTFSLIHDDLPAMDDDDLRRGRPTSHKVFGEALAILAGDGLLSEAFRLCGELGGAVGAALCRELAAGTGAAGMVGGQVLDLLASAGPVAAADVHRIHRLKTGSLIRACVRIGGILGGSSVSDLDALGRYGKNVGLAFQIVDDILDVVGEQAKLGKGTGSDAAQAKITFPSVFGLDVSRRLAQEATAQAILALEPLSGRAGWLRDLSLYLLSRDR